MRRNVTLFLGAEGCAEAKDEAWIREATPEEIEQLRLEVSRPDFDNFTIDDTGRPYWLMTVLGSAPLEIWNYASSHLRAVRLEA